MPGAGDRAGRPVTTGGPTVARAMGSSGTLRRLARQASASAAAAQERCDLCSAPIPPAHRHLLELAPRAARCVCYPCSVLFEPDAAGQGGARFRLIPDRRLYLPDFRMSDPEWERLRVPVGLAFVFQDSTAGQAVAFYPSPLGPTQALLEPRVWQDVVERNPPLRSLRPDVEALLVNRSRAARDHYLVPIDECYRLVGLVRGTWRGLTGGQELWRALDQFFASLRERSRTVRGDNA
jgi:Family of unknown function (DUF5947)